MTTRPDLDDDPVATLLRRHAPAPLADDGFSARTMQVIPAHPFDRIDAARALVAEERRYNAQARLRRWALAGVAAGMLLLGVVVAFSPGQVVIDVSSPTPSEWLPLSLALVAGSFWYAWNELRRQ